MTGVREGTEEIGAVDVAVKEASSLGGAATVGSNDPHTVGGVLAPVEQLELREAAEWEETNSPPAPPPSEPTGASSTGGATVPRRLADLKKKVSIDSKKVSIDSGKPESPTTPSACAMWVLGVVAVIALQAVAHSVWGDNVDPATSASGEQTGIKLYSEPLDRRNVTIDQNRRTDVIFLIVASWLHALPRHTLIPWFLEKTSFQYKNMTTLNKRRLARSMHYMLVHAGTFMYNSPALFRIATASTCEVLGDRELQTSVMGVYFYITYIAFDGIDAFPGLRPPLEPEHASSHRSSHRWRTSLFDKLPSHRSRNHVPRMRPPRGRVPGIPQLHLGGLL